MLWGCLILYEWLHDSITSRHFRGLFLELLVIHWFLSTFCCLKMICLGTSAFLYIRECLTQPNQSTFPYLSFASGMKCCAIKSHQHVDCLLFESRDFFFSSSHSKLFFFFFWLSICVIFRLRYKLERAPVIFNFLTTTATTEASKRVCIHRKFADLCCIQFFFSASIAVTQMH